MTAALFLAFALAPAVNALETPPPLGAEQMWSLQLLRAIPEGELRAAAAESEARASDAPLLALAAKHGVREPAWLKERLESAAAAATIVSLGDSVSAGSSSCPFPILYCPQNSWSTGSLPTSLRRALAESSGRAVDGVVFAVPAAKMSNVPAQAYAAFLASSFGLDVERVTLLIGHNDPGVCGAAAPGQDAKFEADYATTLRILGRIARARNAKLFVSGIIDVPVIARYADVTPAGGALACRDIWSAHGFCKRILGHRDDPKVGLDAEAQIASYDAVLGRLAEGKDWARFTPTLTDYSRNGLPDPAADLSPIDCFHPSAAGQALLGRANWEGAAGGAGVASFFALAPLAPRRESPAIAAAPKLPPELGAELEGWLSADARP